VSDHLNLPDGSALVERQTHACGASVTLYRGVLWNDDDTPHDCDDESADPDPTVVIFRKWPAREGGGIIALFPYEPADVESPLWCESYMDEGGWGRANYYAVLDGTAPALPDEYAPLKRELESEPLNCRLAVRVRTPHGASEVRTGAWRKMRERGTT
jgi:hypothetical protein